MILLSLVAASWLAAQSPEGLKAGSGRTFDGNVSVGAAAEVITPATNGKVWGERFKAGDKSGHYTLGDPCEDADHNGRCDQIFFAGYMRVEEPRAHWQDWLRRGLRRDSALYDTADGVRDDLHARALVLKAGGKKIGLVSIDAVGLLYPEAERIRERVKDLGFDLVIVQATHNHSGPDTIGLWGPLRTPPLLVGLAELAAGIDPVEVIDGKDPAFMERLREGAAAALREADARARPARLYMGAEPVPGVQRDLREPFVFDSNVETLQARDVRGQVIATVANFAIHPEVLRNGINDLSADVSGAVARRLEAAGGVGLHSNGAIGGLITNAEGQMLDGLGETIGGAALESVLKSLPAPVAGMDVLSRKVFIPLDNRMLERLARRGVIDRPLFTAGRKDPEGEDLQTEIDLVVLKGPKGEPLAELFSVPGELAPEVFLGGALGDARASNPGAPVLPVLKDRFRSPRRFLLGLGNDELGYILPLNDFVFPTSPFPLWAATDRFGREHYEETVSASSQLSEIVAWTLMGLLEQEYQGRTELTPEEVSLRARRNAVAALSGQDGAVPALVRLYLHEPEDAATALAREALLRRPPLDVVRALSEASAGGDFRARLRRTLLLELARRSVSIAGR